MIVVEGPDGSGKTTLCEYICKQFNLQMGERATKDRDKIYATAREDSWKALRDEFMATEPPRVWDRIGPYSDPIYSWFNIPNERECAFTAAECNLFQSIVGNPQFGVVILCLPELSRVKANLEGEHQLEGVSEHIDGIYTAYKNLVQEAVKYDYQRKGHLSGIGHAISFHLRHRQKREQLATRD
jgi:hypothetical protein